MLLCYNDGDLVDDAVRYLREQGHDLVVWDHGSTDETPEVLRRCPAELVELQSVPRSVDFYGLYPAMSDHLMKELRERYDWVSWPDQDEFLEGPDRGRTYQGMARGGRAVALRLDPVQQLQFLVDQGRRPERAERAVERVRHYSLFPDCGPRIRSWRASATNIRQFNHNPPLASATRGFSTSGITR